MTEEEAERTLAEIERMYSPSHRYTLEHTETVLHAAHSDSACQGYPCTIHGLSNHRMRAWAQQWNSLIGYMERVCPHGVAHIDPDEFKLFLAHACDGCCGQFTPQ